MRILSTMGLAGVLKAFAPAFEAAHHLTLDTTLLPTVKLLERIRAGERADLAILTAEAVDELSADGILEPRIDLARSYVGVAVKAGAPHPDIGTADAFVATLLGARSVVMSQSGASGIFMAGLLRRLGIEEAMRDMAVILPSGYTASLVAAGQAEIAIQQVSELMVVDGVEIVGRLPAELGGETVFSAAPFRGAAQVSAALALAHALADPARAALYSECGLKHAGITAPNQS